MRTKLLISTALVATAFCVNAAQAEQMVISGDASGPIEPVQYFNIEGPITVTHPIVWIKNGSEAKLTQLYNGISQYDIDQGDKEEDAEHILFADSVTVEKGATLNLNQTSISAFKEQNGVQTLNIQGALNLDNSYIEAGTDYGSKEQQEGKFSAEFDGATVTAAHDSTIGATKDITIKNSTSFDLTDTDLDAYNNLSITNSTVTSKGTGTNYYPEYYNEDHPYSIYDEDGPGVDEYEAYGLSAQNINVSDSTLNLKSVYLGTEDGNIELSGEQNNITLDHATIKVGLWQENEESEGSIKISGGTTTLNNKSEIKNHTGNLMINGGTLNINGESEVYAKKTTVSGENTHININGSSFGGDDELYIEGGTIEVKNGGIDADEKIVISGGKLSIDNSDLSHNIDEEDYMPAGTHMAGGNVGLVSNDLSIKGGETTLITSARGINSVQMTGGTLTLNTTQNEYASTLWSAGDITLSGGTINLNSTATEDGSNITTFLSTDEEGYTPGNIYLSGAEINVHGEGHMLGTSGDIVMSGGSINIDEASALEARNVMTEDGHVDENSLATIQFNGGKINLKGDLAANVEGNTKGSGGEIIFNNSNAVINGDVKSVSLSFHADHNLSKTITGTIESLDDVTISEGTLHFDKQNVGDIKYLEVLRGATLDIGLNTLISTGNHEEKDGGVFFKDGSTLKFTATSADTHGQIKANYVNISENGTTLNMNFNGAALAKDESMTLKLFDQSEDEKEVEIEGKFEKLATNARYKFTDEGNGNYKITNIADASDVVIDAGGNANNAETAEAWDNLDTSSVKNATTIAIAQKLTELSNNATTPEGKKAYVDALTALAPETAPAVQQVATETANQIFGAVGTRLSGGSIASTKQGMSSGDSPFTKVAVWVQGLFNKSKLDKTKKAKGFDSKTYGTAMGIEGKLSEEVKLGVGYAYSKTDIDGFKRDTDVKTHTAIVYGEYKPNNWFVNGIVTYGWSDYDEKKNVGGMSVKADYDVEALSMQAMTGYDMNINGFGLTPETGLRYVHIKNKSYKNSVDERVKSSDSDIITGVVGARVYKAYAYNHMILKPEFKAAMTYDLANDDTKSVVTLVNGSSYAVSGKALNRFGVELGVGLTMEVNDNVELSLGYEAKFREDYQDHTGLINAKYKF